MRACQMTSLFPPSLLQLALSSYLAEGFLHLQNVIGQAIIENKTGQTLDLDVTVEVKQKQTVNIIF